MSRLITILLALSVTIGTGFLGRPAGTLVAAQSGGSELDLPAMTLTPADLDDAGLPGFGVSYVGDHSSGWRTIGDVAYDSIANYTDSPEGLTLDRLNVNLSKTGWLRQYR